jgi:hypothetical protein
VEPLPADGAVGRFEDDEQAAERIVKRTSIEQ